MPDVHGTEMRARRVRIPYTMNNGHVSTLIDGFHRRHYRVESGLLVEGEDLVLGDAHHRPVVPVEGVGIGDNRIEVIIASSELENHQDRIFTGASHCDCLLRLGKLIFACGHDQLQELGYPSRGCLNVLSSVPAKVPAFFAKTDQPGPRSLGDIQRPEQVEAAVHDLGGCSGPLGLETVNDDLDTMAAHVAHQLGGEVYPLHQRSAVDPLSTRMPALDTGGVQQILPHIASLT